MMSFNNKICINSILNNIDNLFCLKRRKNEKGCINYR